MDETHTLRFLVRSKSTSSETTPRCENYEVCNMEMPDIEFSRGGPKFCILCSIIFGAKNSLELVSSVECPICLDINKGVLFPNCKHSTCISCFNKCFFGKGIKLTRKEPKFPYQEIENAYRHDPENSNWDSFPLIEQYNIDWNNWAEEQRDYYEGSKNLRQCPICRK